MNSKHVPTSFACAKAKLNHPLHAFCVTLLTLISACELTAEAPTDNNTQPCKDAALKYEKKMRRDLAKKIQESEKLWSDLKQRYEHQLNEKLLNFKISKANDVTNIIQEYIPNGETLEFAEEMLTCAGFSRLSKERRINDQGDIVFRQSWSKNISFFITREYIFVELPSNTDALDAAQSSKGQIIITMK